MVYWGRWFSGFLLLPFIWGNGINCLPIWFCLFGEYNLAYPVHVWTIWIQISDSKFNIFLAASFIYLVLYALCTWFCKIKKYLLVLLYLCLFFERVFMKETQNLCNCVGEIDGWADNCLFNLFIVVLWRSQEEKEKIGCRYRRIWQALGLII